MPIKTLPTSLLQSEELAEAASRFCTTLAPFTSSDPVLGKLVDLTGAAVRTAHSAFGIARKNAVTKSLLESDELRDMLFNNLVNYIRGARTHYLPVKAEAGDVLHTLFQKYGTGLSRAGYAVESTKLKSLFVDLEKENARKAAEELDISQAIAELVAAENDFSTIHKQLINSKADWSATTTVSEVVVPLRKLVQQIVSHVAIMEDLDPQQWEKPVEEMNAIITELVAKARSRKSRIESAEKLQEAAVVEKD